MLDVIANTNPRLAVNELNGLGIKKTDIISIIRDNGQFLIFYWK